MTPTVHAQAAFDVIGHLYLRLLTFPLNTRLSLQHELSISRDWIAAYTETDPEEVQNLFEASAHKLTAS